MRIDETFFLGGIAKVDVLRVLKPHIFFDDQLSHLEASAAAASVPSGQVPREQLELLPAEQLPPAQPVDKPKRRRTRPRKAADATAGLDLVADRTAEPASSAAADRLRNSYAGSSEAGEPNPPASDRAPTPRRKARAKA